MKIEIPDSEKWKRRRVVYNQIINSEKNFVQDLRYLAQVFYFSFIFYALKERDKKSQDNIKKKQRKKNKKETKKKRKKRN